MTLSATLLRVPTMTTRQLAGSIARNERARVPLSIQAAADTWGLGRATIGRVERGDDARISDLTYRQIEGALGLPRYFFAYVIDGDRERIKRLPSRADDPVSGLHEDLRRYVLEALDDILTENPPQRRATDRRPARRRA